MSLRERIKFFYRSDKDTSVFHTGGVVEKPKVAAFVGAPHPFVVNIRKRDDEMRRRAEWFRYFMGFAEHAATKSKDSTKVGAVLVGPDGEVRLTGFNGPPRGVVESDERRARPAKYLYTSHAEENLIGFAAKVGIRTEGCSVYATIHPCSRCARMLIQAGIKAVYHGPAKTVGMPPEEFTAAEEMFREAGVTVGAVPAKPGFWSA